MAMMLVTTEEYGDQENGEHFFLGIIRKMEAPQIINNRPSYVMESDNFNLQIYNVWYLPFLKTLLKMEPQTPVRSHNAPAGSCGVCGDFLASGSCGVCEACGCHELVKRV